MAEEQRKTRRAATRTKAGQQQLPLRARGRGGRRAGAGRKPKGKRAGVSHSRRPALDGRHPIHVTMRMRRDVWNLRTRRCFRVVEAALRASSDRHGMRLTHYTVQGNHLHLVVEASGRQSLSRGMQGLSIRVAKGLNRLMRRSGSVFEDRYHAHILRTPREVRNAVSYVLSNTRIHAERNARPLGPTVRDPYAAGPPCPTEPRAAPSITHAPRTWLLRVGWRRAAS